MTFYLGVHHPHWLRTAGVPLFVSRNALRRLKRWPAAAHRWAKDSGMFSRLLTHGEPESVADYAASVRRAVEEIGLLDWATPQDWMCEPVMLQRTRLTVRDHQRRTVENYLDLRALDVPVIPVLQGWTYGDYFECLAMYDRAGVDLRALPLVGLGSVCRRQDTDTAEELVHDLSADGLRLHLFGFKLLGLRRVAGYAASSDSMAWSFAARKAPPLTGCTHRNCANCLRYALLWRERVVRLVEASARRPAQGVLSFD